MLNFVEFKKEPFRLFVVGDIHGCADELGTLLSWLEAHVGLCADDIMVFVGDYIDRGPDTKGVVDQLINFRARHPQTLFLKGNHEEMLLHYLYSLGEVGDMFLQFGGVNTAASYGALGIADSRDLHDAIPESHLQFFGSLQHFVVTPAFAIVHAGINCQLTLFDQEQKDILWARDAFMGKPHILHRTVVFGHTPVQEVYTTEVAKIGIDTGLVHGNKLTCIELGSGETYQIRLGSAQVTTGSIK